MRGELLKNLQEAKAEPKKDQVELSDAGKEEVKKLGLKWLGKGYGTDATGVTHKNEDGELVKVGEKGKKGKGKKKDKAGDITKDPDAFDRFAQIPVDPDDPERAAKTKKARDAVKKAAKKRKKDKKKRKDVDFKRDWEGEAVDRSGFETGTSQPKEGKTPKERAGGKGPPAKYPTQQEILDGMTEGNHDKLKEDEEQRRIDRDFGNAGAGGPKASKGESMYCTVVDDYDEDEAYNPDTDEGKARIKKKEEKKQEIEDRARKVANREERKAKKEEREQCRKKFGKDRMKGTSKWTWKDECKEIITELAALKEEAKKYKHLSDYPSASELEVLDALGYDPPDSDEAREYLAKREVWAEEECERLRKLPTPNVYSKASPNGFGGDNDDGSCSESFLEWGRAAYDGGMETKRLLDDAGMKEKPRTAVQSEQSTDDVMQANLENRLTKAEKELEACKQRGDDVGCEKEEDNVRHYRVELDSFSHNREYHDTYIVGEDENGRIMIISVSNKKGSDLEDPQNNTTPATRLRDIKEMFADDPEINGGEVAEEVAETIDEAIEQVTTAQEVSVDHAGNMDNDVGGLAKDYDLPNEDIISTKRRKKICAQGNAKSSSKKKGNPPIKFNKWLREKADPKLKDGEWDDICSGKNEARMLELMAQYSADTNFHKEHNATESNPTGSPSYDPFAKVFIKMGEAEKEADFLRWKKNNPNGTIKQYNIDRINELRAKDPLTNTERVLLMKLEEQEAVNEAHQKVIDKIYEADAPDGYHPEDNPDAENGPHARGYIRSVMKALHFDKYIMMDDEASKRMLVQMGIEGVTPDDFRNCLAELSGYKPPPKTDTPEGKKALIEYIEKNARLDRSLNPPAVVIGTGTPQMKLMEDTWRSAGTSQKVASAIGEDMRECLKEKVKGRRIAARDKKKGDAEK
jgi:hypothetical protein